jgi:probable phosphoglycerate mutase
MIGNRMRNSKTTIILIRHGETVANKEGIFRGRADFPLNENGRKQAKLLAEDLKRFKIDILITSPLSRSVDTARAIADIQNQNSARYTDEELSLLTPQVDDRFTNISLGMWEGTPHSEISEKFPQQYHRWLTEPEKLVIPGAETLDNVMNRTVAALTEIVQQYQGKTIAIISHRAVLKPLIAGILGIRKPYFWKIHLDTASYSILNYDSQNGFCLYQHNLNRHLAILTEEKI